MWVKFVIIFIVHFRAYYYLQYALLYIIACIPRGGCGYYCEKTQGSIIKKIKYGKSNIMGYYSLTLNMCTTLLNPYNATVGIKIYMEYRYIV